MANIVKTQVMQDGERSVMIKVIGILDGDIAEAIPLTDVLSMKGTPDYLRLDTIKFAVEDKLTVLLWWGGESDETLICPLAGRGLFDFEWFGGEHNSKVDGHTPNIELTTVGCEGKKHFALWLDCSKARAT